MSNETLDHLIREIEADQARQAKTAAIPPGSQMALAAQRVAQSKDQTTATPPIAPGEGQLMAKARELAAAGRTEDAMRLVQIARKQRGNGESELDLALSRANGAGTVDQTPGMVGGASAAATDGFMFGFGDEYLAGLSAVLGVQPDGTGGANWFDYNKPMGERYTTALDAIRSEQQAFRETNPKTALGAEVVGGILGPGKGGASFVNAGRGAVARIGRGSLTGAGAGAAYGFGEGEGGAGERSVGAILSGSVGALGGGTLVGAGQGFNRALSALSRRPELREAIPTVEGLRETANALYAKAREMGGELPTDAMRRLAEKARATTHESGFDKQLHPRVAAVLDRLQSETGPKSLQEVEILRRVAGNAAESLQPDERRIATQIIDAIDDAVDNMGAGSHALREARDTWARLRRLETVEAAIEKAALQKNFAAGLQTQFKALLRNPKRLRGFSEAQKQAIRRVANGGTTEKVLRGLSGLLSPTGLPGMALAGGTAIAGPGIGPAMGVAATGLGTRAVADALTRGSARRARDLAGMSESQRRVIEALLAKSNPAARAVPATGVLANGVPK